MNLLVFSTVPVVAAGQDWVTVVTDVGALTVLISDALRDLAEAGVTVTGPSMTLVHPLARLISRTAVVYLFEREPDYSARDLSEFQGWAESLNCVFRIGNGPFRNLDGESLSSPGMEVKVPVHRQARDRRVHTLRDLRGVGYDLNEDLPVVPAESELVLRDPAEVVHRLVALSVISTAAAHVRQETLPPTDDLVVGFELIYTARERAFLGDIAAARGMLFDAHGSSGIPPPLVELAATFRGEQDAAEALAWALLLKELPNERTDSDVFDAEAWQKSTSETLPTEILETGYAVLLAQAPGLRQRDEILETFDLVHVLHHSAEVAVRQGAGDGRKGALGAWVRGDISLIARSWNRALAWICSPRSGWGEAERLL